MINPEEAAGRRAPILAAMEQEPVDLNEYSEIFESAEPWEQIEHPENFEWSMIRNVPLRQFPEATPRAVEDVEDPEERREHRDRIEQIIKLLKKGGKAWPVVVDAESGAILDGWHRLGALHSLGRRVVDVLYA
jgi:hypothetical protein